MENKTLLPTYVYTEMTPNPNSLKFVADRTVIPEGRIAEFETPSDIGAASPLATSLFQFPFVKGVFIMSNFVTVTRSGDVEWDLVKNELREVIQRYLMENQWAVSDDYQGLRPEEMGAPPALAEHKVGNELEQKIADILDEYVKPAVERDGGIIQLDSFRNGTVTVNLRGACSGCPSSTVTLKDGIENLLKSMLPEVNEVVALT
ncbi:MAG: NifU family protein [Flavobacteriales bacterium]|nr:NifU family protein [Flavobacteriales bacterium]